MNQWNAHEKLVLDKLDTHGEKIDKQSELITDVRIEIAKLKTNMRIYIRVWGTIAGFVGAAALVFLKGMF